MQSSGPPEGYRVVARSGETFSRELLYSLQTEHSQWQLRVLVPSLIVRETSLLYLPQGGIHCHFPSLTR
jgi:hypothetical protein